MTPIQTCVFGTGLAGLTFHVPFVLALPELFNLHSVLERNAKGAVQARFGVSPQIYQTLEEALNDEEIELVIIGTPNETHYRFAKAALESGKHVLVDKPVTASSKQAKELAELAVRKGLILYAYQNRRFDSDFLALKRLLAIGDKSPQHLGDLVEFESHFDRFRTVLKGTWKDEPLPGAGQTYDLGTHLIDQALALFGRPQSITAFINNVRGVGSPEVDDQFTIFMQYPAGSVSPHPFTVILRAHILSARASQLRYQVRGTKGTYYKSGVDVQEDTLKAIANPRDIFEPSYGIEPKTIWGFVDNVDLNGEIKTTIWPSLDPGRYVDLFKNLASVIREGAMPLIQWQEATSVIEMIELAHRSAKEGITIKVPQL